MNNVNQTIAKTALAVSGDKLAAKIIPIATEMTIASREHTTAAINGLWEAIVVIMVRICV